MSVFRLFVPKQSVGADLVYFDLFNASGSGSDLEILGVLPVYSGAVAVTGLVSIDLLLTRTSAVGTGGTAATYGGVSTTAMTINGMAGGMCPALITARLTPSGGATAGAVISWRSIFSEETASSSHIPAVDMVKMGVADMPGLMVSVGSGLRVVQGAVASVGTVGFDVAFRLIRK